MNKYQNYFRSLYDSSSGYKYEHPETGEIFTYRRKGVYRKGGVTLRYKGKANEQKKYIIWIGMLSTSTSNLVGSTS